MTQFQKGNKVGVRFGSGQDTRKGGRRKQIYTVLKEKGFAKNDIRDAYLELLHYDITELDELIKRNEGKTLDQIKKDGSQVPALYVIVARALIKAKSKGDLRGVERLIEQVIGKPQQTIQQETTIVEVSATEDEIKAELQKLEAAKKELAAIEAKLKTDKNAEKKSDK